MICATGIFAAFCCTRICLRKTYAIGFEQHLAVELDFFLQLLQRIVERCAAHCCAARTECANAVLHYRRIPVQHHHVINANAKLIGRELRECRFLALTVRRCARHHCHCTGGLNAHRRTFPTACRSCRGRAERADFAISRHPDTHQLALLASLRLFRAQLLIADGLHGLIERRGVIA